MSLPMYHLPCVCCTLVSEIRVYPEMLWHIDVLRCILQLHSNEQQGCGLELLVVCREDYQRRQVGECAEIRYKQIQPTETLTVELYVAARQLANVRLCESEATDGLTVLLFCDIYINIGATLNLLQYTVPACVICGCTAAQTNSAETSLALLAM